MHSRWKVVRWIVSALTIEKLSQLPTEIRQRMRGALSLGYAPREEKEILGKILLADLVAKTPPTELREVEYQQGLIMKGAQKFVEQVRSQLDSLASLPTGRGLLMSLARSGKSVTIVPAPRANEARPSNYRAASAQGKVLEWNDETGKKRTIRGNGKGSDTTINYNQNLSCIGYSEAWQRQPPTIWLGHELIHADDSAYGRMDPEIKDGIRNYERQAIGLPPYEEKEFTENKLRAEWHDPQPLRPRY
jgi:Effector protein